VAAERWDVHRTAEWTREVTAAHALVAGRLPKRVREALALPAKEQKRLIAAKKAAAGKRKP
jgi:hypothetical protein